MNLQNKYNVGIYCRLSRDEKESSNESLSIANQKSLLTDYVHGKGWKVREIYVDDGFQGSNFERPSFKQMISDVELGVINCIITKDLSRLGRDHVDVGYYMGKYFPEKNVRYIAIHENVDTFYEESNDMAPFLNLFNEFYPRDVSRKVKAVKYSGFKKGDFMNSKPAYGYDKSPMNKHVLVVDEDAAITVKKIFRLYASGYNGRCIAEQLTAEGVPNPRNYSYTKTGKRNPYLNDSGSWNTGTIMAMLKNQVYIGNMVQGKRKTISYRTKKVRKTDPEQWVIVENTHESLIDLDLWDNVQTKITQNHKVKTRSITQFNGLFSGIIRCGDCGSALALNIKPRASGIPKPIYKCSRYANHGKSVCSSHYIEEEQIEQAIVNDIKHYALLAEEKEKLVKELSASASKGKDTDLSRLRSKLIDAQRKFGINSDKIKKLFEEKFSGNINENIFRGLMQNYEKEQETLEKNINAMEKEVKQLENKNQDVSKWVSLIQKHLEINTLDREIVCELIESIAVLDTQENEGKQKLIKVKYKFVGNLSSNMEKGTVKLI